MTSHPLMTDSTDPFTREKALSAVEALEDLHDSVAKFLREHGREPTPDSQAMQELQQFQDPRFVATAHSQGEVLIEAAGDQLMGVVEGLEEPALAFSPWSNSRAALEASAISAWLLDTSIDTEERVRRSFSFRIEGLEQQKKIARTTDAFNVSQVEDRIDEVEDQARQLGFSGIKQMQNATDLVKNVLHEEMQYRLSSAVTHGHDFALREVGFGKLIDNPSKNPMMEKEIKPVYMLHLCNTTAEAFLHAVRTKARLLGIDEKLEPEIRPHFEKLGLVE